MKLDLSTLSDKDLMELQKRIAEEKKARKELGELLFKGDLKFTEGDYWMIYKRIESLVKKKLDEPIGNDACDLYAHKIQSNIIEICDLVYGNFSADLTNRGKLRISRGTSRIIIDEKVDYESLYLVLLNTILDRIYKENEKMEEKHE